MCAHAWGQLQLSADEIPLPRFVGALSLGRDCRHASSRRKTMQGRQGCVAGVYLGIAPVLHRGVGPRQQQAAQPALALQAVNKTSNRLNQMHGMGQRAQVLSLTGAGSQQKFKGLARRSNHAG